MRRNRAYTALHQNVDAYFVIMDAVCQLGPAPWKQDASYLLTLLTSPQYGMCKINAHLKPDALMHILQFETLLRAYPRKGRYSVCAKPVQPWRVWVTETSKKQVEDTACNPAAG